MLHYISLDSFSAKLVIDISSDYLQCAKQFRDDNENAEKWMFEMKTRPVQPNNYSNTLKYLGKSAQGIRIHNMSAL